MSNDGQKLFQVFKLASDKYIEELTRSVEKFVMKNPHLTLQECLQTIKEGIDDGFILNKCEWVVKEALITSPLYADFIKRILQERGVQFTNKKVI